MSQSILGTDQPAIPSPTSEERTMAILAHVLTLAAGFIAPLVIYLIKKDESSYVRDHARESLNFQLTMIIVYLVCFVLIFVLIGLLLIWLAAIAHLVLVIIATIRASENKLYRYPLAIRFVR